jgi:hypothetical protein
VIAWDRTNMELVCGGMDLLTNSDQDIPGRLVGRAEHATFRTFIMRAHRLLSDKYSTINQTLAHEYV